MRGGSPATWIWVAQAASCWRRRIPEVWWAMSRAGPRGGADALHITGLESDILTRFGAQLRLHELRGAPLDDVEDTIFLKLWG